MQVKLDMDISIDFAHEGDKISFSQVERGKYVFQQKIDLCLLS
jgi:hypothetical protein